MKALKERYKGQLLLLLLLLAPVVTYQLAISRTVTLWRTVNLEREQIERLLSENKTDDRIKSADTLLFDQSHSLSDFLFSLSGENDCVLESYIPYSGARETETAGFSISTAEAVLTGDFINLINVIAALDGSAEKWKIISADFKSSRPEPKTKAVKIKLSLIIQYISS